MKPMQRWMAVAGALALAGIVGVTAYNAGLAAGLEDTGKLAGETWHRHWGGGFFFFPFAPLFFFAFWVLVARGIFGRGRWHRGGACRDERLDEWHRRAHEILGTEPGGAAQPR